MGYWGMIVGKKFYTYSKDFETRLPANPLKLVSIYYQLWHVFSIGVYKYWRYDPHHNIYQRC